MAEPGAENLTHSDDRRPGLPLVAGAVVLLAAAVVVLALLQIDRTPRRAAGAENLRNLWPIWAAGGLLWIALSALWLRLKHRAPSGSVAAAHAASNTREFLSNALLILAIAAGARAAVLIGHEPALSDDVYRYVFDGRNLAGGINTYTALPSERASAAIEAWPGERAIAERINHPEMTTVYLPTSQWVFGLAGRLLPERWSDPSSSARFFRAVMVCFELAMMILLAVALHHAGRSAWWLALYGWHPLPLAEIAGSGHQDAIGMALVIAALLAFTLRPARVWLWTVMLAPAVLVKPMVLPLAAYMLRGYGRRAWLSSIAIGALVCAAIAAPLLMTDGAQPLDAWRATAERFSLKWAHFGSVYEPLLSTIHLATPAWTNDQQERLARTIMLSMVTALAVAMFFTRQSVWRAGMLLLFAMVLLSPTAHPWYLLWALALMPMAASERGLTGGAVALWMLSFTNLLGYWQLADVVHWATPGWVLAAAYGPVYAALLVELLVMRKRNATDGHGE